MLTPYTTLSGESGGSVARLPYANLAGCNVEDDGCGCGCSGEDGEYQPAEPCCPTTTIIIREVITPETFYKTFAELRGIVDPAPSKFYTLRNQSFNQAYYYDPSDTTSEEALPNTVVTGQNKRLKLVGSEVNNYD